MTDHTGFLEESPGVRSMSRLAIAVCLVLASVLVGLLVAYVVHLWDKASAPVVGAIVGGISAVVLNGAVALAKRNSGDEVKP